jgi:asparagine synthetase B (glutamine-hydrolysing)
LEIDLCLKRVRNIKYLELANEVVPRKESGALEELNHLLEDTTGIYIRSDVSFGAFLSGGLDSSVPGIKLMRQLILSKS